MSRLIYPTLILFTFANFSVPAFAIKTEDGFVQNVSAVEEYKAELKVNQLLHGWTGAAYALTQINIDGYGDVDYWIRDSEMKSAGLRRLADWIVKDLNSIRDPSLKIVLNSIVKSIAAIDDPYGDLDYYIARASRFNGLADQHHQALSELAEISDVKLKQQNLSTQARALVNSDAEAFAAIMTTDMNATLANLQARIETNSAEAERSQVNADRARSEAQELDGKVKAAASSLERHGRAVAELRTEVTAMRSGIKALAAAGMRGQESVHFNGAKLGDESMQENLRNEMALAASTITHDLRGNMADRAHAAASFNPNYDWIFTIADLNVRNYGLLSFRRGVRVVIVTGTAEFEVGDAVHKATIKNDFRAYYYPKRGKLKMNLKRFVARQIRPELALLRRIATGTAQYADALNAMENKFAAHCEALMSQLAADEEPKGTNDRP